MKVEKNISLKDLNTFRVDVKVDTLCTINSEKDFLNTDFFECLKSKNILILGGGSNILFTKDFKGTVILLKNTGKEILKKTDSYILVKVNAGENWDSFVQWSVENNLEGLHNLAYIPGTVGATPIQNVGAYGVEVKDFIKEVEVFNIKDHSIKTVTNTECKFGYRDSIFKNELKDKVIVKSVTFKLPIFKNKMDSKYLEYSGVKEGLRVKILERTNYLKSKSTVPVVVHLKILKSQYPNILTYLRYILNYLSLIRIKKIPLKYLLHIYLKS